jgi:virginiamycin B lyase
MNAQRIRSTAAFLLIGALGACSGAGSPSLPNSPAASSMAPGHGSKHKVKAKIRITIPKRKHHRRAKVHGHYVSAATQSIAIAITPSSGPVTNANADLTPDTNPNCVLGAGGALMCSISLTLDPGSYTASFTTYDGLLQNPGDPDSFPTGNPLSANQNVPLNIVAGQANLVGVALDGVPTGVAFVPAANSTLNGDAGSGFTAAKCGPVNGDAEKVGVYGVDADGNYILGPGAPVPALDSQSGSLTVATPGPLSPNTFTLTHPISATSQGPWAVTYQVTPAVDSGGSAQSSGTNISVAGGTAICGVVTEYALSSPSAGPEGIVAGADGNLWFTEIGAGKVGRITTSGTINEYGPAGSQPYDIVAGKNNDLWYTDVVGGIGNITTSGVISEYTTGLSGASPIGVTIDSSGTPWFTECTANEIANFSGGVVSTFTAGIPDPSPFGITLGPDGNFWFAAQDGHVVKATPAGALTPYSTTGPVQWITTGAGGDLWFTEGFGAGIGRITTAGVLTEYPIPSGNGAYGIAPGPDGNIWFTEQTSSKIASITTGGVITEFAVPTTAEIDFLTAGPDGAIWFTSESDGKIGKMQ